MHVRTAKTARLDGDDDIIGSRAWVRHFADHRPGLKISILNGPHWLPRLSLTAAIG
jgi:hypothetical protein